MRVSWSRGFFPRMRMNSCRRAKSNRKLTDKQKALLKQWIAEGAKYEKHWTFTAPVKAPLPEVKNTAWVRNEIDRFVLAKLEAQKLSPSHPRRTARR
jgi:hypothetical protein